ncbi:M20/M25/M40 family metallo-hydrolase [Microvirga sp. CF3062]|uniref:M20/M25/M40 family metallo-hydrolase n=1 Tax=Microvirga sp. CF3062 TaxID=3110182 RepID=UPI002E75A20F|nr:M20/M25/M40 family metallo-hydrolase [Microvirga sp. CF3062]MEE1657044.1 M20/M25/M40 family metallo-hydrolase [Microvirga sp. CF3062]
MGNENRVPRLQPNIRQTALAAFVVLTGAGSSHADVGLASAGQTDPFRHVQALQDIATANGGNRAAGTPGYDRSAEYVADQLRAAGYTVRFEEFTFPFFEERSPPVLVSGPGEPDPFTPPREALRTLASSGSGDVTAPVQAVDLGLGEEPLQISTSGCEREDFAGFNAGSIALVRRGTCPFQTKAEQAQAAGAAGLIIMNQGTGDQTGTFGGRLSTQAAIPVLGVTTEVGRRLAEAARDPSRSRVRLKVDVETGTRSTRNVLADRNEISGSFIVVGAHLDSVSEGPGMNDNASGSAAVLETALRLAKEPATATPVRFAFWGAEERGLIGSRHHVDALTDEERRRIRFYINLDMVGSVNPGRFIQLSQTERTAETAGIIQAFNDTFASRNLVVEERSRNQRGFGSDDAAFAGKSIPTLGLFTGAGNAKSDEHAARFGGQAGQPYDPCYHKACDNAENVDRVVLGQMTDALTQVLRSARPIMPDR